MFLYNPIDGAPVKDVWFEKTLYFDEKKGKILKVGDVVFIDDAPGAFVLSLYEFLKALSRDEAKKVIDDKAKQKFVCPHCGVDFGIEKPYKEHLKKHEEEKMIDGIPIAEVTVKTVEKKEETGTKQEEIDAEAKRSGLYGPGLEDDKSVDVREVIL